MSGGWRLRLVAEARSDTGRWGKVQEVVLEEASYDYGENFPDNYITAMRLIADEFATVLRGGTDE